MVVVANGAFLSGSLSPRGCVLCSVSFFSHARGYSNGSWPLKAVARVRSQTGGRESLSHLVQNTFLGIVRRWCTHRTLAGHSVSSYHYNGNRHRNVGVAARMCSSRNTDPGHAPLFWGGGGAYMFFSSLGPFLYVFQSQCIRGSPYPLRSPSHRGQTWPPLLAAAALSPAPSKALHGPGACSDPFAAREDPVVPPKAEENHTCNRLLFDHGMRNDLA